MNRIIVLVSLMMVVLVSQANETTCCQATDENFLTFENIKSIIEIIVMALVGWASIKVAKTANKLMERQIKNEELLNMPVFEFKDKQFTHTNLYDSESTEIYNNGGSITDLKFKTYTFLRLRCNNKEQVYYVFGFMYYHKSYNSSKGMLVDIKTFCSKQHFHKIYNNALAHTKETDSYAFADLEKYIVITYKDFKNTEHTNIYKYDGPYWILVDKIPYDYNNMEQYRISQLSTKTIDELLAGKV